MADVLIYTPCPASPCTALVLNMLGMVNYILFRHPKAILDSMWGRAMTVETNPGNSDMIRKQAGRCVVDAIAGLVTAYPQPMLHHPRGHFTSPHKKGHSV